MLAIIPARGGSKGLPGKNILNFAGKPLIAHTIEQAKHSKHINKIIVSTDDKEIGRIAQMYGADVPFLRPEHLATDNAKAIDNYIYTIDRLNQEYMDDKIENFIVLQPTSPLRTSGDIDNAIELFNKISVDSLISVYESEIPPSWFKVIENNILSDYLKNQNNSLNRQEAEKVYLPNGAIYIFNINILKEKLNYYTNNTIPYIMSQERSIDIDNLTDFKIAEYLFLNKN